MVEKYKSKLRYLILELIKLMKYNITSAGPSITQSEIDLVNEAVSIGWQDNRNLHVDQFVEEFGAYVDRKFILPTSHCTGAIHLALLTLGIKPGDEVIVPDITWVASAAPITYVGAKPVFVDVEPDSWCICPKAFERAITSKTKAVIIVDLFGNMPKMNELLSIAKKHHLKVIEDAAEGLGATYYDKPSGAFGDVSLFSFSPTKLITAGQGGVFATDDEALFEKAKYYAHHGINKKPGEKYFWSHVMGHNYNWTNIQAALALSQLRRIETLIDKKKEIYEQYHQALGAVEEVTLNQPLDGVKPCYWISVAMINPVVGLDKEYLCHQFNRLGIDLRPFFYPISSMPPYHKYLTGKEQQLNKFSYHDSQYGICLPSGNNLTKQDIHIVCQQLLKELAAIKSCP
tara:strand:- start:2622 stop:3824 length:1203 start_codon:yes stop_codon:yes gene_type:complete